MTDNGTPAISASDLISVTVNDVNSAPVLDGAGLPDQTATVGIPLSVQASATDPDLPNDVLTYSISPGLLPDMNITSGGWLTWTPSERGQPINPSRAHGAWQKKQI